MPHSISDQIAEYQFDSYRIDCDGRQITSDIDLHAATSLFDFRSHCLNRSSQNFADRKRFGARVPARLQRGGKCQYILDHCRKFLGIAKDQSEVARYCGGLLHDPFYQVERGTANRGQRRAQVVRYTRRELKLHLGQSSRASRILNQRPCCAPQ